MKPSTVSCGKGRGGDPGGRKPKLPEGVARTCHISFRVNPAVHALLAAHPAGANRAARELVESGLQLEQALKRCEK